MARSNRRARRPSVQRTRQAHRLRADGRHPRASNRRARDMRPRARRMAHAAWRMAHGAWRVSRVACRVSRVACRVSRVACRVSRVACRVSRAAHRRDAPPARHTQARVRGGPSARRPGRVPERRDIGRPHRGAPLFHPTTRMNVSTSAICPMSIGSRSDVDHPAASGARCPKTSIRHLPPAHEATRAARAAHACAHMDSPTRARGELRACRAPRARPPCRSSSRRAGRSAPAAPRRARRRRPRAASPCLARPIRSYPSGRPDKRPRSDRG
ncbi:glycogen branching protein [Burkholderia pseudomallei]|nr:glycogen branching protein [Burkholderia pseudomallei]